MTLLESADGDDADAAALLEDEDEAQTSDEAQAEQAARALLGLPGTCVDLPGTCVDMPFWHAPCWCILCLTVPSISGFVNSFSACALLLLPCTACECVVPQN